MALSEYCHSAAVGDLPRRRWRGLDPRGGGAGAPGADWALLDTLTPT